MVLFKLNVQHLKICYITYLHSTMVLFKLLLSSTHSPILLFTFHYGPIQISNICFISYSYRIYIPLWSYSNDIRNYLTHYAQTFTFHYGPIQMLAPPDTTGSGFSFTFHYGPIQMFVIAFVIVARVLFTFHYGPIQMFYKFITFFKCFNIYIPLWSYSN